MMMDLHGYDTRKICSNEPPFETETDVNQLRADLAEAQADYQECTAILDEVADDLGRARATIHQLQEKCEKIPGLMAEAEAHRAMLMERDATIAQQSAVISAMRLIFRPEPLDKI